MNRTGTVVIWMIPGAQGMMVLSLMVLKGNSYRGRPAGRSLSSDVQTACAIVSSPVRTMSRMVMNGHPWNPVSALVHA